MPTSMGRNFRYVTTTPASDRAAVGWAVEARVVVDVVGARQRRDRGLRPAAPVAEAGRGDPRNREHHDQGDRGSGAQASDPTSPLGATSSLRAAGRSRLVADQDRRRYSR